ncbi:UPF0223 family protein [Salinicoccus kekensis]|uniref:Uncharacterized protein YktA (UPF0223 family) n=1 Tax=Salinicoccus kekensis TaxID=714307 RepID=A0A285UC61_9STAP|nr:UPF0223 family protein [Salinicoccus kekensis]SOC37881.1 uncharacterized protein YktA (UPF0223 family) [Salinicoccus kekensis]
MAQEYSYPLDTDWTTDEVVKVVEFFEAVEYGHDEGIAAAELKRRYRAFKEVVPSKSGEKTLFREFKEQSGLESYTLVRQLKDAGDQDIIRA